MNDSKTHEVNRGCETIGDCVVAAWKYIMEIVSVQMAAQSV